VSSRYPEPRAGRFAPHGEQRDHVGDPPADVIAGGYPNARPVEQYGGVPQANYDLGWWYETINFTTLAGTAFAEAGRFSGRPDSVTVHTSGPTTDIRFRRRGGPPGDSISVDGTGPMEIGASGEILEARDPAGAGGTAVRAVGRFSRYDVPCRLIEKPAAASS